MADYLGLVIDENGQQKQIRVIGKLTMGDAMRFALSKNYRMVGIRPYCLKAAQELEIIDWFDVDRDGS